jgi:hypothetical protein
LKRREGIGGVTIAVVGLVLALSVGIAATAHGGVFNEGLTDSSQDLALAATAPEPAAAVAPEEWGEALVPAAGVRRDASSRTTTTVSVRTAVSGSAASATGHGGTCIVKTRIVTSAPVTSAAHPQPQVDVAHVAPRGGQALRASAA